MKSCLFAPAGKFTVTAPATDKSVTTVQSVDDDTVTGEVVATRIACFISSETAALFPTSTKNAESDDQLSSPAAGML
jgi:hypothetical protein